MTVNCGLLQHAVYLVAFVNHLYGNLFFLFKSLHRILFEALCSQLRTECPNKGMKGKCMNTALTFWSPAQLQAVSMCICVRHVCVFAAELTKLWPWHSLCWILLQVECRNYIRTLHRVNATTMYVCGTNAFSPTCDYMVSILHMELVERIL